MDFVHKEQFAFALLDLAATAQPLVSSEPTAKSSGSRSASQTVWQPRVIQPSPMRAIPLTRPTECFHIHSDAIYRYDSDNDFTSSSSSDNDDDDDEADDFCSAFRPLNLQPICSYERGLSPIYPTSTLAGDKDFYPTSSEETNVVSSPPHSFLVLLEAAETLSSSPRKSIKAPVPQALFEDPFTSALTDKLDELTLREPTPPTGEPIIIYKQLPASSDREEAGCMSSPNLLIVEQSTSEEADLFTASFSHSPPPFPESPVISNSTDPLSSLEPVSITGSPIDWFTNTEEEAPWSEECMFPISSIRDSALSNPESNYIHPSKDLLLVQEDSVSTEDAAKCSLYVVEEEEDEEEEEEDEDEWEEESEQYGEDFVVELYDSDPELEVDFGSEGDEEQEDESESDSDSDDEPIRTPRHLRVRIDLVDWSFDSESNSSFDDFDENPYAVRTVVPHLVLTPPTEPEVEDAGKEATNPPLQSVKYLVVPKNTFKSPKPPHTPPGRPVSSVHEAMDEEDSDSDDEVVEEEDEEREEDQGEVAVAVKPIHGFDDDVEGEFDKEYEEELLDDTTPADATEVVVDEEAAAEEIIQIHVDLPFWDVDEEVTEAQESIIAHDALPFREVEEETTEIQESAPLPNDVSKGASEVEGAGVTEVLSAITSLPSGELEEVAEVKDTAEINENGKVLGVLPAAPSWVYEVCIRKRLVGPDNEVLLVEEVEAYEISDQSKVAVSTSKAMESLSMDSPFDNTTSHPPSILTSSLLPQKRSCSYPADAPASKRRRIDKDNEDVANMLSSPQCTPVASDLNTSPHEEVQPVFIPSHAFSLSFDVPVKQEVVEEVALVYAPLVISNEELVDAQVEEAPLLSPVTSILAEGEPSPSPLSDITPEDAHTVLDSSSSSREVNIPQEVKATAVTSYLPILDLPLLPYTATSSRGLSNRESQASSTVHESSSGFDIPSLPSTTSSALKQPKPPKRRTFLLPPPVPKPESRESAQEAAERLARRAVVLEAQREEMAWRMTEEDGLDFQRWNRRDPVEKIIRRRQKLGRKDSYRRSYGKRGPPESISPTAPSVVGQGLPMSHLIGIGLLILVPTIVNVVVQVFMTSFVLSKLNL